jgi:hypothetical protein
MNTSRLHPLYYSNDQIIAPTFVGVDMSVGPE